METQMWIVLEYRLSPRTLFSLVEEFVWLLGMVDKTQETYRSVISYIMEPVDVMILEYCFLKYYDSHIAISAVALYFVYWQKSVRYDKIHEISGYHYKDLLPCMAILAYYSSFGRNAKITTAASENKSKIQQMEKKEIYGIQTWNEQAKHILETLKQNYETT